MTKAVLTHKPGSIYDDLPEERYHFPATYRRQVEAAIGDFAIYYEPGRSGQSDQQRTGARAYVAVARVSDLRPDPKRSDHFYATIVDYLGFDQAVPFREGAAHYESALCKGDGTTNRGAFGRAVRPLPEHEFEAILRAGFARELPLASEAARALPGLAEDAAPFERPLVQRLIERPLRDAAFARIVRDAYGATCAMTGIRIINGGGRPEAQAAHIRPVVDRGPDSVRNGLALSATVHWMFDRGLVAIGDPPDHPLLFARQSLPANVTRLFNPDRRLRRPADPRYWPAPQYLAFHRTQVFKG